MGGVFRWHSILWILLFWAMDFSSRNVCVGLMEVYDKECQGTEMGLSYTHSDSKEQRYEEFRKMYENCTLVRGNIEIVYFEHSDAHFDFSFLETILEVNGYVLIVGNYVDRIRLNGLRVIRGRKKFSSTENNTRREFSLYVARNSKMGDNFIGLKELQMTSLVEIMIGDVLFKDNKQLCFGETTINWKYILHNNPTATIITYSSATSGYEKTTCSETCHENCTTDVGRFCWAKGPDMCQAERQCPGFRRGCSASWCSRECIGGCTGPDESDCVACKMFIREGRCVDECNKNIYNPTTETWDKQNTTYKYGTKCVDRCPENMLIENGACVSKCMHGFMENKTSNEKECVSCSGTCPKTCDGTGDTWLHGNNLAQFNQCTKVEGSLAINNNSFNGHKEGAAIQVDDLEILKDVEEITGVLRVDAKHQNLTTLLFLSNLRVIGGIIPSVQRLIPLQITYTSLRTLELKSLRKIMKGEVVIFKNNELCYAHTINWTRMLTSTKNDQTVTVKFNANSTTCEKQGLVCSDLCSNFGCWGPGNDNCVSCQNYSMDGRCVSTCEEKNGFYSFETEDGTLACGKCHEECLLGCNGDGPDKCVSCKHVKNGNECLFECPKNRYSDLTGTCQWCDGRCDGCSGNGSHLGVFGCKNCQPAFLLIKDEDEKYCMKNISECDNTSYVSDEFITITGDKVPMKTCRKCHEECYGCETGKEATDCIQCRNYKQIDLVQPEKVKCVSNCSYNVGYYDAGNKVCRPCHQECKHCNGKTKYDCPLCRNVRIYNIFSTTEEDLENNTLYESKCEADCPVETPNKARHMNDTESFCTAFKKSSSTFEPKLVVSIFVVLFLLVAIVILIFAIFWRKQKLQRLKESVLANDEIPMISASNAKPDMSLLRLIKESELRRGNTIGSGAFGTVYKGIWIPEKENVKIPVAIKVLQETSNTNQNVELLDEARIMASVCHPYCVRILAVCMTAQMMLITQLMPLGCLLDYVRKEKSNIGSRALLLWSVQIAKGMKYLEDLGIVHRDLAARNVLVHSPNQVKITDFGLAKLLDCDEEEIHSEGGKMPIKWLALECIQHRIYTHKSDVWSYGVTLWEMFTYGERPYENLAARQIPQALEKGERLPQPNISTIDVYMIMIKCWMLDVDSRPTFSDLANEFTRMAQDPGRFLVIPGDKLMRLPSSVPDAKDIVRLMSLSMDEPDLMVVSGDDYLRPMDLDLEGDLSSYPPTLSPLGPLTSIPEDDAYENTRPVSNNEQNDDLESPSDNGKIDLQYSREPSQRYTTEPYRSKPGQTPDTQKNGDTVEQHIRVDEDGYLPPQSTITTPSYLDVVDSPQNDSVISQEKQNPLDNQQQQYLDMRPSTGLSKDNPDYYEDDAKYLTTSGGAGSNKVPTIGTNQNRSEYYNVPPSSSKLGPPYSRLPETDV